MKRDWIRIIRRKPANTYIQPDLALVTWLMQHAGEQGLNGNWFMTTEYKGGSVNHVYCFRDPKIAMLFKLTWGGSI